MDFSRPQSHLHTNFLYLHPMGHIKAAFFDIDGTLVSFKTKQVPASAVKAINYLRGKGIKVIVSTGRSITAIDHIKHLAFDGFICFNGGCLATHDGTVLYRQAMHPEDVRQLVEYSHRNQMSYALMYEHGSLISSSVAPDILALHEHIKLPLPPVVDRNNLDVHNVLQGNIFLSLEAEATFMEAVMPNSVASRWAPSFADVNPKGLSKLSGVEFFCNHFDIEIAETIAFGDGGNDIDMIKGAGIGIAMGNANDNVKAIADYITDDVDDDGIWNALVHFGV